jgi:hypothetical protein
MSDHDLVKDAGLAGVRGVPGGLAQPDSRGFQAQAELIRRLTEELRATKVALSRSGVRMEWLTKALIGLTVLLAILTAVLVFKGG